MRVIVCMCVFTCLYASVFVRLHVCICVSIRMDKCVCACVYVCQSFYIYRHVRIHAHVTIRVRMRARLDHAHRQRCSRGSQDSLRDDKHVRAARQPAITRPGQGRGTLREFFPRNSIPFTVRCSKAVC